jgi:hypothetical protein
VNKGYRIVSNAALTGYVGDEPEAQPFTTTAFLYFSSPLVLFLPSLAKFQGSIQCFDSHSPARLTVSKVLLTSVNLRRARAVVAVICDGRYWGERFVDLLSVH